jgi:hypothetical protein
MPLQEISRGGDRDDDPRPRVAIAAHPTDQLLDRLGAGAGELAEQLPPAPEQRPQQAWDREHHRGAEAAATAGEGHEHTPAALSAPQSCEAVFEKAALQELPQHSLDHQAKRPVLPDEARRPRPQELLEMLLDQTVERRLARRSDS